MAVADRDLNELLASAGVEGPLLDSAELEQLWAAFARDEGGRLEFLDAVVAICEPTWEDGSPVRGDEMLLRAGRWHIDLKREAARSGLLTVLAAMHLGYHHFEQFGATFLASLLTALCEVERVDISAGDGRLLLEMQLRPAFREGFMREDHLYDLLPDETRSEVNRYDFADFIERLRAGGYVDERDGLIRVDNRRQ